MKVTAICSCPRLGFTDFTANSLVAFSENGVGVSHAFGVYWAQALSEGIKKLLPENDLLFTTDFDSIFTGDDVRYLIELMEKYPEADAICSLQQGRGVTYLFTPANGANITREELEEELVPIRTGNFGLTIFRPSAFEGLTKPWFMHTPSTENKDWETGSNKVDDDMYFWYNFQTSGKKAFLAPRSTIGHLELMIKWPSKNLTPAYQDVKGYRINGKPTNIWQ